MASLLLAPALAGCGPSIKGDFPQLGTPGASVLTPDEVKARTAELERAKDTRQTTDVADIEGRKVITH
jgi:hypothetical protein